MANCINCGQQISDGITICPHCGAVQEERTVLINEANTQQPQMNQQMGYGGQNVQQGYGQPQMNQQMGYGGQNVQQGYGQPQMNPQMGYGGQNVQQGYGQPQMNQQMGYGGQNMQQGYGQPQMNPQMGYGGQNVQQGYGQPQMNPQQKQKKPVNGKMIGIIAGVVVLVLAIVMITKFIGPGAPTQKAAIKSYYKAIAEQDADDYLDACFSKKLLKAVIKEEYGSEDDDIEDYVEEDVFYWYDFTDVRKIKIADTETWDKSDIEYMEDYFKDVYDIKINISKVVDVDIEMEVKEDGEWENDDDTLCLYKIGGKWYVAGEIYY